LFVDCDHSWVGIWQGFSPHVVPGGMVALHASRSVPGAPDLDSVHYPREAILADPGFRLLEAVDSLTVLERMAAGSTR
jgi:hypothetical protein